MKTGTTTIGGGIFGTTAIPELRFPVILSVAIVAQAVPQAIDGTARLSWVAPAHKESGVVAAGLMGVESRQAEELLMASATRVHCGGAEECDYVVGGLLPFGGARSDWLCIAVALFFRILRGRWR